MKQNITHVLKFQELNRASLGKNAKYAIYI